MDADQRKAQAYLAKHDRMRSSEQTRYTPTLVFGMLEDPVYQGRLRALLSDVDLNPFFMSPAVSNAVVADVLGVGSATLSNYKKNPQCEIRSAGRGKVDAVSALEYMLSRERRGEHGWWMPARAWSWSRFFNPKNASTQPPLSLANASGEFGRLVRLSPYKNEWFAPRTDDMAVLSVSAFGREIVESLLYHSLLRRVCYAILDEPAYSYEQSGEFLGLSADGVRTAVHSERLERFSRGRVSRESLCKFGLVHTKKEGFWVLNPDSPWLVDPEKPTLADLFEDMGLL